MKGENYGIGLSIAKQLVELNNGTIKANYNKKTLTIEINFKDKENNLKE